MKCLIYARQSAGRNDVSESVENQKEKCTALAQKEGYEICGVYEDLNTSGKTYPTGSEDIATMDIAFQKWYKEQSGRKMYRPGLGGLIEHLSKENIEVIICYDITRLYRPISGSFLESHINQILMVYGIKILTVNNGIIDINNFNDSLIAALQNRINHEQIAIQRRKSKEALKNLKDKGEYQAGLWAKWGFTNSYTKRGIEIVPEEAEMVKFAFESICNGISLNETVRQINAKFSYLFKNSLLDRVSLRKLLMSPIYAGYQYNSNGDLIKSKQTNGIVSFQLWKEVQEIFNKRRNVPLRPKKTWLPLSPYIVCGVCGNRMITHSSSKRLKHYSCERHTKDSSHTPCKVNMTNNHHAPWGLGIVDAVYPLLSLAALKDLENAINQNELSSRLEQLKVELTNLIEREKKLTKMFVDGLIDEDTVAASLKTNAEKKSKLNMEILSIEQSISDESNTESKQIELLKKIVNQEITNAEYEKLARRTFKKIGVKKESIIVETIYGTVEIPRQHISNHNNISHYWMNMDAERNINLIYYRGYERFVPTLAEMDLLADFGKMKVWYIKNS